jgi:hypothetical protein
MEPTMPDRGQAWRKIAIALLVAAAVGAAPGVARAGIDGCTLLKTSEVDEAIGPHTHFDDQTNPRDGTCEWIAKAPARKGSEFNERITVHVYEGNKLAWARGQVRGEPVEGVAKNAKWDRMSGEMWFDCAGGRLCLVKVAASSGKQRQAIATKLATLVESRVR